MNAAAITECKNRADLMAYLLGNGTHFIKLNGFNTDAVRALCVCAALQHGKVDLNSIHVQHFYTRKLVLLGYIPIAICVCS